MFMMDKEKPENEVVVEAETPKSEGEAPLTNPENKYYVSSKEKLAEGNNMTISEAEQKLTEFQRKLIHNVVYKSMDRATAAKAAGSTAGSREALSRLAWETLKKPQCQAYMGYIMEKKNELAGIDKVEVIEGLREVLQLAITDSKYKDALTALRYLGEAIGLFKSVSQSLPAKAKGSVLTSDDDESPDAGVKKDIDKLLKLVIKPEAKKAKPTVVKD